MDSKRDQNGVNMDAKLIKNERKVKPTWIGIKATSSIPFYSILVEFPPNLH